MNRRLVAAIAAITALLVLAACEDPDRARVDRLIREAIAEGTITSGYHHRTDHGNLRVARVVVGSFLPADARAAARTLCERARGLPLKDPLRVDVLLLVGSRPAGACHTRQGQQDGG